MQANEGFDFNTWVRQGVPYMPLKVHEQRMQQVRDWSVGMRCAGMWDAGCNAQRGAVRLDAMQSTSNTYSRCAVGALGCNACAVVCVKVEWVGGE